MNRPPTTPVNPADIEAINAIEAVFMLAVYRARRVARRQLAGMDPVPVPSPSAWRLHRDGKLGVGRAVPS